MCRGGDITEDIRNSRDWGELDQTLEGLVKMFELYSKSERF